MKPPAVLKGPWVPLWADPMVVREGRGAPYGEKAWLAGEISDLFVDRGRLLRSGDWSRAHPGRYVDVTRRVLRALGQARVRYCLIGGLAAGIYGLERSTNDVDLQAEVDPESWPRVVGALRREGFRFSGPWRHAGPEGPGLRVRSAGTRVEADLIWARSAADRMMIARRRRVTIFDVRAWVCSPEDLILMKLEAGRGQDELDVRGILAVQARRLDRRRLLLDAGTLGRRRRLVALAREAGLRWR